MDPIVNVTHQKLKTQLVYYTHQTLTQYIMPVLSPAKLGLISQKHIKAKMILRSILQSVFCLWGASEK